MDQRDYHDSHEVVPLRRKDDPDPAERAELASQIFAQEDEIGTFSGRGRDARCQAPPAQIPACASNALGSCLG